MGIDDLPTGERNPSRILEEIGFTKVEEDFLEEGEPKTFNTFKRLDGSVTTEAYDEDGALWQVERDAEADLLARGFTHAPSPLAPGTNDVVH